MDNMKIRQMMIESIAEFELMSGKTVYAESLIGMEDEELIKRYRNTIYDEGYTDGHVDGYFKAFDEKEKKSKEIDSRAILN